MLETLYPLFLIRLYDVAFKHRRNINLPDRYSKSLEIFVHQVRKVFLFQ